MKVILSGYEGSKSILKASSFLVAQYLNIDGFEFYWMNYGDPVPLYTGLYVKLADKQLHVKSWAADIRNYLSSVQDDLIIFALDDYLIAGSLNWNQYLKLIHKLNTNPAIVSARLCISDFYKSSEIDRIESDSFGEIIQLSASAEYSVTTQYCIWKRHALMDVLSEVETPWEFETQGSNYLNSTGMQVIGYRPNPPLIYNCSSSLSTRWPGINISGSSLEDIEYLVSVGDLNRSDLTNRGHAVQWGSTHSIAEAM